MTTPRRIQRKRIKGWKAPADAVYVGRGTPWGNPAFIGSWICLSDPENVPGRFRMSWCRTTEEHATARYEHIQTATDAVNWFRRYCAAGNLKEVEKLRGKDLMCFCPLDQPCHADALLELANK